MLSFPKPSPYQGTKCTVTYGQSAHLQPSHVPSKHKPWSSLLSQHVVHRVDLVLPEESFSALEEMLGALVPPAHFRVTAPLRTLLDGAFFLDLVKTGKVMVISEGVQDVDNTFTLLHGVLRMYLDRETYERAGLVGKTHGVKGDRSGKPRWVVEYDLKEASMLPGKKGFDRLLYACKNVFAAPITWLYSTYEPEPESPTLKPFHPIKFTTAPIASGPLQIATPPLEDLAADFTAPNPDFEELATDLYEWISLIRLSSPRVEASDAIDPYLSSYQVPRCEDGPPQTTTLRKVSWRGFIPPSWVRDTLAKVLVEAPSKSWLSFSATSFGKGAGAGDDGECTFFRPPSSGGQYLFWEIRRD
ncbi:uncharacterized protein DNG_06811 [Cephalotrichum gorgonifer]|uniref:Uncharacterized protein n=1 Tax=Cephalotrichum gorgonifer TaxID=2041049 RepID=A0AAE8N2B6_9PEZI|nr:uncharacterized protein DNG_06811 [Cephalotrichum gorgonifer]